MNISLVQVVVQIWHDLNLKCKQGWLTNIVFSEDEEKASALDAIVGHKTDLDRVGCADVILG